MPIINSKDEAQRFLDNKFGEGRYTIISEYKGRKTPITIKDNVNNIISEIPAFDRVMDKRVHTLKNYFELRNKSDDFQKKLDIKCGYHHFDVLKYAGRRPSKFTDFKCTKCGKEFSRRAGDIYKTGRCPLCENKSPKMLTIEDVKKEIETRDPNYSVLSTEYKGTHEHLLVRHNICGTEYLVSRTNFLSGKRCPHCVESKGEKIIEKFLENNNISFIPQKRFTDSKDIENKPFDFFLEEYNLVIEYDGEFHYLPIFGEDDLHKQQRSDEIKTNYCKEKNISILRIPYWDFENIDNILSEFFAN